MISLRNTCIKTHHIQTIHTSDTKLRTLQNCLSVQYSHCHSSFQFSILLFCSEICDFDCRQKKAILPYRYWQSFQSPPTSTSQKFSQTSPSYHRHCPSSSIALLQITVQSLIVYSPSTNPNATPWQRYKCSKVTTKGQQKHKGTHHQGISEL